MEQRSLGNLLVSAIALLITASGQSLAQRGALEEATQAHVAPAAPPSALLSETAPALLLFDWDAVDGQRTWPSAQVRWPPRRSPVSSITLSTDAVPIRVELRGFSAVDPSTGIPRQAATATWGCGWDLPEACLSRTQGKAVTIPLPAAVSAQPYLTLQVYWLVRPEQRRAGREEVGEVTATWILGPPAEARR